ncbi:hypothetical protein D3C79_964880 [compost metagenome]
MFQREGFIDNRAQTIGINCPNHRLLMRAAADQHTLQTDLAHQRLYQRELAGDAGQNTDERNMATDTRSDH